MKKKSDFEGRSMKAEARRTRLLVQRLSSPRDPPHCETAGPQSGGPRLWSISPQRIILRP